MTMEKYLVFAFIVFLGTGTIVLLLYSLIEDDNSEFEKDWVCTKETGTGIWKETCTSTIPNEFACPITEQTECVEWVWTKTKVKE